jgi:hypothetical protein
LKEDEMIKLSVRIWSYLAAIIIISNLFMFSGCSKLDREGFAIYLTVNDIPPTQMEAQSHFVLTEQPVISIDDIMTYNQQTHEIKLTAGAFERLYQLEVPVQGKSFVVCLNKQPLYWGAFWTPISSISFDGVTIWKPYSLAEPYIITLELGYPSTSFYSGEDPRNNPEILTALEQSSKLITELSISTVPELPSSMKGYELYSWLDKGEWHFDLITGTNRTKTLDEIVYEKDYISEAGWVNIHVVGIDKIQTVLSKLPQNEEVFWLSTPRLEQAEMESINFGLPPETDLNSIKEYAAEHGLNLRVAGEY